MEDLPKTKSLKVISIFITPKTNGYLITARFDGSSEWVRELVFETKENMFKWLNAHLPEVEVFYDENRKYYDLKEVK